MQDRLRLWTRDDGVIPLCIESRLPVDVSDPFYAEYPRFKLGVKKGVSHYVLTSPGLRGAPAGGQACFPTLRLLNLLDRLYGESHSLVRSHLNSNQLWVRKVGLPALLCEESTFRLPWPPHLFRGLWLPNQRTP